MSGFPSSKALFRKVRIGFINVSVAATVVASTLGGALPFLVGGKAFATSQTPAPTVTDPSAAKIVNTTSYSIAGTVHDSSSTTVKIYSDANDDGVVDGTDAVVASAVTTSGTYSISTPLTATGGGVNNFVVTATKSSQSESTPVDVPTLTYQAPVDTTPPTISSASISSDNANSSFAKTGDTVTLTFTTSEAVSTPTVTIDGQSATVSGSGSSWSASYTMQSSDTEGVVPFTIDYTDLAGNIGTTVTATSDGSTVTFDRTNPTTPVAVPAGGTYNGTQNVTLTSTDGGSGVASIYYTNDGSPASNVNGIACTNNCSVSISVSEPLNAVAYDKAGNVSGQMTENYIIDTTAPTVSIDSPTDGDLVSGSVNVSGTVTDANPSLTPKAYTITDSSNNVVDTESDDFTWDTTAVADGTYTITLVGTDAAGNTASDSVTVTVDNTAPTVHITSPTDGSTVNGTVSVSGTYSDANPAFLFPEAFVITDSSNNLVTFSFSDFSWDTTTVADGTYTITLYGEDAAGNDSSESITVTVDNTAPVVTVDNLSTTDTTPTITGTVDDPTATVAISIDGGSPVVVTNNGNGTWSYTVTNALSVGSHTVTADAEDTVGNTATPASGTVTINALPSGGQGGGSGSGSGSNNTPEIVTTSSNGGSTGGQGGGSGTSNGNDNGNVLGSQTNPTGSTSSTSTDKGNTDKTNHKSKNFLGLGWWWLLVLAAILAGWWFLLGRRRTQDEE